MPTKLHDDAPGWRHTRR